MDILEGLESAGRAAVEHDGGPLLLLGAPGTGKTTVLERRYLRLASREGLGPHRILILCNQRRYSSQARDRLVWELSAEATLEVPVYTWHALAYHLVSRHYPAVGFREPPLLLTAPEQWGVVRRLLTKEDASQWGPWKGRLEEKAFVDEVADFCLRVHQNPHGPAELAALVQRRPDWAPLGQFYSRYFEFLVAESKVDYPGLIASAARLLTENADIAAAVSARFPHVLVDDGQEMSPAHLDLLRSLPASNLVVAADPNSGIEAFRGAQPDWVFGFEKWFPGHTEIVLDQGMRIGAPLAPALERLIEHNDPTASERRPRQAPHSTQFQCRVYGSIPEEADSVARQLRSLHLTGGIAWDQMAVLLSQPAYLLDALRRALDQWEVPYQPIIGERPLSAEPPVAWFLELARQTVDSEPAGRLRELLTSPLIGLDFTSLRRLERDAWRTGRTLLDVAGESELTGEFRKLRDLVVQNQDRADECFWSVYAASAYYRSIASAGQPSGELEALSAFSRGLGRFVERRHGNGSMAEYLAEAARADFGSDPWLAAPVQAGGVAILSFHACKGREFHTVAVMGCLDTWIPKGRRAQGLFDPFSLQAAQATEREVEAIADDRRTFYVAASRATSKVIFTASASPAGRARPSRFLFELAGEAPVALPADELLPLTRREMAARLRATLTSADSTPAQRVAAVVVLSEIPGVDPRRWYGMTRWTPGARPIVEGELRTSFSRLDAFENCGLQYLLQSVLGLDASSTYSMKFGTWMHALFQAVHEKKISDARCLQDEYRKLFDDKIFPNSTIARQFYRDGLKMLEVFWNNEAGADVVKAEHCFEIRHSGAVVRGRIDRVDRKQKVLKLTDYKTSKWAPSRPEAQRSLQLAIYHLAARMDPDLAKWGSPEIARLVYPGAFWPDGTYVEHSQTAQQADTVLEKLPAMIAGITAEDFRPSPDADCFFCKMKPLCPLWPEGRELDV